MIICWHHLLILSLIGLVWILSLLIWGGLVRWLTNTNLTYSHNSRHGWLLWFSIHFSLSEKWYFILFKFLYRWLIYTKWVLFEGCLLLSKWFLGLIHYISDSILSSVDWFCCSLGWLRWLCTVKWSTEGFILCSSLEIKLVLSDWILSIWCRSLSLGNLYRFLLIFIWGLLLLLLIW